MRKTELHSAMTGLYGNKIYRLMRLINIVCMAESLASLRLYQSHNLEMHDHFTRKSIKLRDVIVQEYGQ